MLIRLITSLLVCPMPSWRLLQTSSIVGSLYHWLLVLMCLFPVGTCFSVGGCRGPFQAGAWFPSWCPDLCPAWLCHWCGGALWCFGRSIGNGWAQTISRLGLSSGRLWWDGLAWRVAIAPLSSSSAVQSFLLWSVSSLCCLARCPLVNFLPTCCQGRWIYPFPTWINIVGPTRWVLDRCCFRSSIPWFSLCIWWA